METLAQKGITEITHLGQNVNLHMVQIQGISVLQSYSGKAAKIKEFQRINFITSHPKDFSDDIILTMRDNPNISRSITPPPSKRF